MNVKFSHRALLLSFAACGIVLTIVLIVALWPQKQTQKPSKPPIFTADIFSRPPLYQTRKFASNVKAEALPQILKNNGLWVDIAKPKDNSQIRTNSIAYNSMPASIKDIADTETRKSAFISILLPLVLIADAETAKNRAFVFDMRDKHHSSTPFSKAETKKLQSLFAYYECEFSDFKTLLARLDHIPLPLVLAQGIVESGWGRSRFTRVGNALFGQWTTAEYSGIVPQDREGSKNHKIRKFKTLLASVRSYMRNLNTHPAYRDFRQIRLNYSRKNLKTPTAVLLPALSGYAEKTDYPLLLKDIIQKNDLGRFVNAKLQK